MSDIPNAAQSRPLPRPLPLAFLAGPAASSARLLSSSECIASTNTLTTPRRSHCSALPATPRRSLSITRATAPQRRRKRNPAERPSSLPPARRSAGRGFLSVLDDMMEKQYGRGKMYYGPSMMRKQEETAMHVADEEKEEVEWEDLKSDSVLVAGGTGRTGQWVVLGLLNQGFNVRVLTRRFERAEELFGESGGNVDVFEADLNSSNKDLADAVRGTRAVVFIAGNGSPNWFGLNINIPGTPPPSAMPLLDVVSQEAPGIDRFVLVAQDAHQETCEHQLETMDIPHVVVKPRKLSDAEGGLKAISVVSASPSALPSAAGTITRLDLAQVVCQALVHDRSIRELAKNDPDNEEDFQFPSTTVAVSNGEAPFDVSDGTFWRDTFSNL